MDQSNINNNVVWHHATVTRALREKLNGHRAVNLWFTGLSGSGKSTLAHAVEERLHQLGCRTFVFDGDNVRHGLCKDLGFSIEDRSENLRRIAEMVNLFLQAGIISLTAFISPLKEDRARVRRLMGEGDFLEIYIKCPLAVCEERDVKGFYKKARAGEIKNYTGISSPYEEPEDPDLVIDSNAMSLGESVEAIINLLSSKGYIENKATRDPRVTLQESPSSNAPYKLSHLGGEHSVTGSCHLLQVEGKNILVDCGIIQGNDSATQMEAWPVLPNKIDYLFLTHAHIDHIGRVPGLLRQGFSGEIICSHGTKALLAPMLTDAMRLHGLSDKERKWVLERLEELSWGFEYNEAFALNESIRFRLGRAGHIMGSAFVRLEWGEAPFSVIFSGDLGPRETPILPDPDIAEPCDLLVLESTYGNRLHEDRSQRIKQLGQTLSRAVADKGKVFIPAFALGRTQELLYELDRVFSDSEWQKEFPELQGKNIPVIIDSPLGLKVTAIYSRLTSFWDKESKDLAARNDHPLDFEGLYSAKQSEEHQQLLAMEGPCIILAGSGMCTGGRIVEHLVTGIGEKKNDIFFVGYQAGGTPGHDIVKYSQLTGGYVILDNQRLQIKAQVHTLGGYSAHADQQGLIEWVEAMAQRPGAIKLVHGEPDAQRALAEKLEALGHHVVE